MYNGLFFFLGKSSSIVVNPSLQTFTLSLTFHKFSMPWNHGHIDLAILFRMGFCHLGGKREKEKEKKGSAHSTLGFFWKKWPKLPDFEGKKKSEIAKFRQC